MEHQNRDFCALPDRQQRLAEQLFVQGDPQISIAAEFGVGEFSVHKHFVGSEALDLRQRLEKRRKALRWFPWPLIVDAWALFFRPESDQPEELVQKILRLAEFVEQQGNHRAALIGAALRYFSAGRGFSDLLTLTAEFQLAWNFAYSIDIDSMSVKEKNQTLAILTPLVSQESRELVCTHGHAAATVFDICRCAVIEGRQLTFPANAVSAFGWHQSLQWVLYRLWSEYWLKSLDVLPSHRDAFLFFLADAEEQEGGDSEGALGEAYENLTRRLARLARKFNKNKSAQDFHFLDTVQAEIPEALGLRVPRWRKRLRSVDDMMEALHKGRFGLLWNDVDNELISMRRGTDPLRVATKAVMVEMEEISGVLHSQQPKRPGHDYQGGESEVARQELARAICKDVLDKLIFDAVLDGRLHGKRVPNREIRECFIKSGGRAITEEAIRKRRNNIELELARLSLEARQ